MKFAVPHALWVLLLVVPAMIAFFYWSWRVKQKMIRQFVRARLLSSLTIGVSAAREKFRLTLLVIAVTAVLLALARPQWGFAWEESHQKGLDIIVAIDTSRSMLAQDVRPNRIEKTKMAALDLMRQAKSDRLGLVVFAGEAFLQAPLTLDEQAFEQAVEAVSVGIVPVGGTSLSSAIRTSLNSFEKGNPNHKVIVLFTDGEDHDVDADTMAAAKEAAEGGVRIFTIGVGTPEGELLRTNDAQGNVGFVNDEEGHAVKSRLNETLLRQIATTANGFYLPLQGGNPMETLYSRGLAPLPKDETTTRLTRVYQERYHWPLGLAVLCLVLEAVLPESQRTRQNERRAATATPAIAALLLLAFIPFATQASPSSALRDYKNGDYNSAFEEFSRLADEKTNDYRLDYDAGAAAYRAKKYDEAGKRFNSALNSPGIVADVAAQQHAYYNLGNTLYRLGEPLPDPEKKEELWQQSIENYTRAFHLDTNDIDAKNNLAYVKQKLEQLKQQQQQQQKQNQNQQKRDQQNQQQSKNQDQGNKNGQNDQQQQPSDEQKNSQQQQAEQQKRKQEQAKRAQEKKEEEQKREQEAARSQKGGETNGEQTAMAQAQLMTPEEARQLLDQAKDDERLLIFSPTNTQHPNQPGPLKDW